MPNNHNTTWINEIVPEHIQVNVHIGHAVTAVVLTDKSVPFKSECYEPLIGETWETRTVYIPRTDWIIRIRGGNQSEKLREHQKKLLRKALKDLKTKADKLRDQVTRYDKRADEITALYEKYKEYLDGDNPRLTFEPIYRWQSSALCDVLLDGKSIGRERSNYHGSNCYDIYTSIRDPDENKPFASVEELLQYELECRNGQAKE